jgi:hypothetical protein
MEASGRRHHGREEQRTLFFDLTHEDYQGHRYHLVVGTRRYELQHCHRSHPALARARRQNGFVRALPDGVLTHVVENVEQSPGVQISYLMKDPDVSTGTWGMSAIYVLPPKTAFSYAYQRARAKLSPGQPLPLSAKRSKYGLPPAASLDDLMDEQDVIDTSAWAIGLVNLHPELMCADPPTAAHIQTNHIHNLPSTGRLAEILGRAGTALPAQSLTLDNPTGWATLVPYTDEDGVTPLKATTGNNKGLILYDAKWQPAINVPWIAAAMKPAIQTAKNDTSLGADVTSGRTSVSDADLTGKIWCRNDGVASITQAPGAVTAPGDPANALFTLTNITPNYNGYSLTSSNPGSGSQFEIMMQFKNWYLRWLGLYIQFYDSKGDVVPASQLPGTINRFPDFNTSDNAIFVGTLTPEFTIFGIPVQASGNQFNFAFPTNVASRALVLASGLGTGANPYATTVVLGEVMTSIFCLSVPALLIAFGIGTSVDAFTKVVIVPFINQFITELVNGIEGGTDSQVVAIFWRTIVRGLANPTGPLKGLLTAFGKFLAEAEVTEAVTDAIPLVGAILQAIGALGALAEITETSCEVVLSPKTYVYDLVGTYNLSVGLEHDPKDPNGFPAAAATYKVTAIFDNGTPHVQTLTMPGTQNLPDVEFPGVPLGGNLVVTVGFYAADGTQVGHGTTGKIPNVPPTETSTKPIITITEEALPLGPGVTYQHKQKTVLNAQGNHVWECGPAPAAPQSQSACQPNFGNLCSFRNITFNSSMGYIGYGWQSYNEASCAGGAGQYDQIANIPGANDSSGNAQNGYTAIPCSLEGATRLIYDPLGRPEINFYLDTTNNVNMLRQVQLNPPSIVDPRKQLAWGKFNLNPDDALLHPSGAVITLNTAASRLESLKLPAAAVTDAEAGANLIANLHGGLGDRPGLFNNPTVATITAEGVILVVEAGNNRIHALDAAANPLPHFTNQSSKYFFPFSATGGGNTQYLDIAVEFSGFIYVLSENNGVYRLDIYRPDQSGTNPISTTMGFNAAKVTVDYWRNVYSLNYEVLTVNGAPPPGGRTEPSVSQWVPTTPPPCDAQSPAPPRPPRHRHRPHRPLRRDFWRYTRHQR